MHSNKGHDQVGPVANGTATGYATGDAMFKASATAEADLPRRAPGPPHAKRAGSAIAAPSWRVANEDEAAERGD